MAHISEVSVFFDDKRLVHVTKEAGIPREIPMIRGLKPTSPKGLMSVKSIQSTRKITVISMHSLSNDRSYVKTWTDVCLKRKNGYRDSESDSHT